MKRGLIAAFTVARKDLRTELRTKESLNASASFALVILVLFSVACWLVIGAKALHVARARSESRRFVKAFDLAKDFDELAQGLAAYRGSPFARIFAVPKRIADARGLGIEANIPRQRRVAQLDRRLDLDIDRKQMRNPARDDLAALLERWEALFGG